MQIKNISVRDISFMFKTNKSLYDTAIYDTFNLVSGWTVLVSDHIWKQVKAQTISISNFVESEVEITEGKPHIKGFGGDATSPKRKERLWDGTTREVNLIEHLIKTHQIEIIESDVEPALPPRAIMETFLKRFGEKVTEKMSDEEVAEKVRTIKAEMASLESL